MNPFTRIEYLCPSKNQSCQANLSRHTSHNLTPLCRSSHAAGSGSHMKHHPCTGGQGSRRWHHWSGGFGSRRVIPWIGGSGFRDGITGAGIWVPMMASLHRRLQVTHETPSLHRRIWNPASASLDRGISGRRACETGGLVDSPAVIACPPIYAGLNTTGAEEYVAVPS